MTTWRAPACRTTAAAMSPIGPAPVMSTSSPSTGKLERGVHGVAERVEDGGDVGVDPGRMAPHVGRGHRDEVGVPAVAVDADAHGVRAQLPATGEARPAPAADDVPLDAHQVADVDRVDAAAQLDDSPGDLVPEHHRGPHRASAPRRPTRARAGRCRRCRSAARGSAPRPAARRGPAPRAATGPGPPPPSPAPASSAPPLCRDGRGHAASLTPTLALPAVATQATHARRSGYSGSGGPGHGSGSARGS